MSRKNLIQLPKNINPGGLLTIKKAAEITGLPVTTIYNFRRQPGMGVRFYRVGGRIFLKCDEFVNWINIIARQVPTCRLDAKARGNMVEAPGARF